MRRYCRLDCQYWPCNGTPLQGRHLWRFVLRKNRLKFHIPYQLFFVTSRVLLLVSGVCLPFIVSSQRLPGWEYSVFIFLVLNLISFIVIFIGYARISSNNPTFLVYNYISRKLQKSWGKTIFKEAVLIAFFS